VERNKNEINKRRGQKDGNNKPGNPNFSTSD
jgi:hypothetical protein